MKRWMMAGAALVLALTLGTVGTLAASPWCRGGQRDCVQNGVCDGSYQTFLAIQALEPDFTLEQAQELSMGQLQAILDQLEGQEETSAGTSSGQNSCDSQSQGAQNGWNQTGGHHGAGHGKSGHE